MLKKIAASILIFPFLIVPLFCCCKTVQASSVQVEHCDESDNAASADHHEHSKDQHSHASCDCHSLSTAADVSSAQVSFLSFPKVLPTADVLILTSFIYPKSVLHRAYVGPPIGLSPAVPFYTLYHSLRI